MFTNTSYFKKSQKLFQNFHQTTSFTALHPRLISNHPSIWVTTSNNPQTTKAVWHAFAPINIIHSWILKTWRMVEGFGAGNYCGCDIRYFSVSPTSKLPKSQIPLIVTMFTESWIMFVPFGKFHILKYFEYKATSSQISCAKLPLPESTKKNSMLRDRKEGKRIQLYLEIAVTIV